MYKNYKIDSDGTPKYDGKSYKIEPERRNKEVTEEWKRRLETDYKYPLRRRAQKTDNTVTINTKYIFYLLIFIVIIGVIQVSNNKIENKIDVSLSSAVRDFGNGEIKPQVNNEFLHIDLLLNNSGNNTEELNFNNLTLKDNNGVVFKPSYLQNQNQIMDKALQSNSQSTERITFELPTSYVGDIDLILEDINGGYKTITTFRID